MQRNSNAERYFPFTPELSRVGLFIFLVAGILALSARARAGWMSRSGVNRVSRELTNGRRPSKFDSPFNAQKASQTVKQSAAPALAGGAPTGSFTTSGSNFWNASNGPSGGTINTFAVNKKGQVFAGTVGGGVYLSTDNGNSWSQTGLNGNTVNSLVINSFGYVFAATDSGLYLSTDNGTTWTYNNYFYNDHENALAIDQTGGIFIGDGNGINLSTDNGTTWYQQLSGTSVYSFAVNSTGMLIAGTNSGVYTSPGGFGTWNQVGMGGVSVPAVAFDSSGDILAGTDGQGLYSSTDNGSTWNQAAFANGYVYSLGVSQTGSIFAGTDSGGVFVSNDTAATWTPTGLSSMHVYSFGFVSSGEMFVGTWGHGILSTFDGGNSWNFNNVGLNASYVYSMVRNSSGDLFVGTYGGGVYMSTDDGGTWNPAGAIASSVRALALAPSGYIFAGTDYGCFYSTDNGANWLQTSLVDSVVYSLTVDPSGRILAGTGDGLYVTSNNGGTWTQSGISGSEVYSTVVAPSGWIFAGTNHGIYLSSDNGSSWNQNSYFQYVSVHSLAVDFSGKIYAGESGSVYASIDSGASWPLMTSFYAGNYNILSLAFDSGGYLYAGTGGGGGVYISSDDGTTWAQENQGLKNTTATAFTFDASGYVYVATGGGGVLRSATPIVNVLPPPEPFLTSPGSGAAGIPSSVTLEWRPVFGASSYRVQISDDPSFASIFLDQSNITTASDGVSGLTPGTIYYWRVAATSPVGTGAWSRVRTFSTAADQTFWTATGGPPGGSVNGLAVARSSGYICAATDGGIYRSTDDGGTWDRVYNTESFHAVAAGSGSYVFAGTSDGVYMSTDAGLTWSSTTNSSNTISLAVTSTGTILAGTFNNGILASTDNGTSWKQIAYTSGVEVYSIAVDSSGYLYSGTYDSTAPYLEGVYRSTDNGATWNQVGLTNIWVYSLAATPAGNIIAGTSGGGVYVSADSGQTWTQKNSGLTNLNIYSLAVNSWGEIFAGSGGSGVFSSTNGGETWTATGPTNRTFWSLAMNPTGYVFTGADSGGVYKSTNPTSGTAPAAPILAAPSDGLINAPNKIEFKWNPSPTALTYEIQVSTDAGFSSIYLSRTGLTTTSLYLDTLSRQTEYYWRVSATNSSGTSAWSNVWNFTTSAVVPPTITSISPTSGSAGETVTIYGANFNSTAGSDAVFFGPVRASVLSASSSQLTVTVPSGAGYSPVWVTDLSTGLTTYSRNYFTPTFTGGGAIADSSFAKPVDFPTITGPGTIKLVDVDGDGKPDLLTAGSDTVSVLLNESSVGSVSFGSPLYVWTGAYSAVQVGDLDGDGKPDIVVSSSSGGTVTILRNTSTAGAVTFQQSTVVLNGPIKAIADVDGDGRLDLVNSSLGVYRNTSSPGNISFNTTAISAGQTNGNFTLFDIDGDGKSDIVAAVSGGKLAVFRNTSTAGAISFSSEQDFATSVNPMRLVAADMDGDGKVDLVTLTMASIGTDTISIYRNTSAVGSISFASGVSYSTGGEMAGIAIAVADLNGDGKPDVASSGNYGSDDVYPNTSSIGNVSLGSKVTYYSNYYGNQEDIAIGDVDADGKPDIEVTYSGGSAIEVYRNVMSGSQSGLPAPTLSSPANGSTGVSTSPYLSWTSTGALSYHLQLSTDPAFGSTVDDMPALTSASSSITGLADGITYYWRVNATYSGGTSGWSSVWHFTTAGAGQLSVPSLIEPSNTATNVATNPVLMWTGSSAATGYLVQISDNAAFPSPLLDDLNIGSASVEITNLSQNTTYYWRVQAFNDTASTTWSNVWTFTTFSYPSDIPLSVQYSPPYSFDSTGYQMFGLPGNNNFPIATIISGSQGSDWNAYYDNGADQNYYVEYDGSSTFSFTPGAAFWILSRNSFSFNQDVATVPLDTGDCYGIQLHGGWNLISDPFEKSVAWPAVQAINGTSQPLWSFSNGSYSQSASLIPYSGYYFYNDVGLSQLRVPYVYSPGIPGAAKRAVSSDNTLSVRLSNAKGELSSISVGSKSAGSSANSNIFAPPENFERASLAVIDSSLNSSWKKLARDVRDTIGNGQEFDFHVVNKTGKALDLNFNVGNGLASYKVYLVDRDLLKSYHIADTSMVVIPSYNKLKNYSILIGSKSYVDGKLAELLPKGYLLCQNYPNPFNPVTVIRFEIPTEGRVSLVVYDILGRKVETLMDADVTPGYYEVPFDGTRLASGVYFYRIAAPHFQQVKKMMLLK